MKLELAPFQRERELREQRALFSECFPENRGLPPETEPFYRRKFQALPATPPSYEYIARDDEGLAGYYAALPFRYAVGDEVLLAGMVCDVMTAPRLRGKGVFARLGAYSLGELERAGIDFVTGYPRRPEVVPGHLKVGWEIAFRMPMYLLPLSSSGILRQRRLGLAAPLVNAVLRAGQAALSIANPVGRGVVAETLEPEAFFAGYDYRAFFERWKRGKGAVLLKTEDFLRWRFAIRQDVSYRVVAVRRGEELLGMSIVRSCDPDGFAALGVLDVMCGVEERLVLRALRREWIRLAREWGRELVLLAMSEFHARRLGLWKLGFLRTPVAFDFIVKRLSPCAKAKVPSAPDQWHLMWIDSDDL